MLNNEQRDLINQHCQLVEGLTLAQIEQIAESRSADSLSDEVLVHFLETANLLYRSGCPFISDADYDAVFLAELARRHPDHPYLLAVEPEPAFAEKTIDLPVRMLSTEKAYSQDAIEKWLLRIEKSAQELDIDSDRLLFRATPKLDGYAAYDDGQTLYTRGDGRKGTDITRVFDRGLMVAGNGQRGQGAGEIVVSRQYFQNYLAEQFENARNFQASIIKEKDLEVPALEAIERKAAMFFPFAQLPDWQGSANDIRLHFADIVRQIPEKVDFDVDGVVFEVTDESVKQRMGSTRHHHRWQIAYKHNVESALVNVLSVTPQTSRSGRVNPVAELEPTKLSGAVISRATAHHYGMVKSLGIGPGTLIELTRSGLVIPKIERVVTPMPPQIPDNCPSCGSHLVWDSDYLYCLNKTHCPAQIENTLEHFFRTLGNVDGFGAKTIEKLHAHGVNSIYRIYQLALNELMEMGFGEKTSQNLLDQLQRSRLQSIEDWRFLGAFGIYRMGLGNCERLLQHYPLNRLFDLSIEDIVTIEGFAEKTAEAVVESLKLIKQDFEQILSLGFNLIETAASQAQAQIESPVSGKLIVFTGTMVQGSREDMQKEAKRLGAKVANSVTGKTDILVAGEKVGATKLSAAQEKGVQILSEQEYLTLING
ncbi:helix-hairpin-helix domain-containing protein [Methylicorpusculum oleiharenae]|uniref:helix-hairpin-helix domain-containing protein n=1 Tax=Methylicorpusculum oleiharenae TaxID=1338687 RepID=UPI0013576EBE|nr:helix-hairpin-helix domain-containing protein [Methylicorpusculum oleiharenae]MCD2452982.1 helix-hairpin-helix domain-containing protein [Methylicorpusculum oleiharenae]